MLLLLQNIWDFSLQTETLVMEYELPEELPSTLISPDLYCIFYTLKLRKFLKENTGTFIHWKHFISIQKISSGFQWTISLTLTSCWYRENKRNYAKDLFKWLKL